MKKQKPLKDPKHWVGYIIVTLAISVMVYFASKWNLAQPVASIVMFAIILTLIAIIDGAFNHKVGLQ